MAGVALPSFPSTSPLRSENGFELLCACATTTPPEGQFARIASWDFADFDLAAFLRLADHHGVSALVAHNLLAHARNLPAEVRTSLRSEYEQNLRRNLWFSAELARILDHFALRELRVVPFKGPVLAQSAYRDLGLRCFSDLDLLISRADLERAKCAFGEIGYHPSEKFSFAAERFFLRTGYERSFDGAAGKNLVELQWSLLPYFYAVDWESSDFTFEDLLARATQVELCGSVVPCLLPEDSLLAVCLHAAKHLWTRLIWVADVAESFWVPGIDLELVVARARSLGIERIVGVSCRLAERLLGTALPAPIRRLVDGDSEVASLGEDSVVRLSRGETYDFQSGDYFRQILKLRERPKDRWRYLWRLVWTPGPGEVAAIALPEILFPLYRGVRILRLSRKLIRG